MSTVRRPRFSTRRSIPSRAPTQRDATRDDRIGPKGADRLDQLRGARAAPALARGGGEARGRAARRGTGRSMSAAGRSRTSSSSRRPGSTSASIRRAGPTWSAPPRTSRSETRTFDVVLCNQVLEHTLDPAKVVRGAPARGRAGRARPAVDARRAGVPPRAAGSLALDACRPRAALPVERGVVVGDGDAGFGACVLHRDADGDLRGPAAQATPRSLPRAADRRGAATGRGSSSTGSIGVDLRPGQIHANYHVVAEA